MINASSAISQVQVRSISHIVASAVRGLDPSAVAIVDQRAGLAAPHGDEEDQLAQAATSLMCRKFCGENSPERPECAGRVPWQK